MNLAHPRTILFYILIIAFSAYGVRTTEAKAESPNPQKVVQLGDGTKQDNQDQNDRTSLTTEENIVKESASKSLERQKKHDKKTKKIQENSNVSVLVLDLDDDGIELTGLRSSNAVYWDIDLDSFAEASAWVTPDDGFLALDRNEDGIINNNDELFGTATADGFTVLSNFDDNSDGLIDVNDHIWAKLLIWQDLNTDGTSQKQELFPIKEGNLISLDIKKQPVNKIIEDSKVTHIGMYEFQYSGIDGVKKKQSTMANVMLSYTNTNTIYDQEYSLDYKNLYLPTLRGYGILPDLHIAIPLDNEGPDSLLSRVKALNAPFDELFDPQRNLEQEVHEILYRWAKVQDIDPASRGPHINARRLGFLESFLGKPFVQSGANNVIDPLFFAAISLRDAYHTAFNNIFARLVAQSSGKLLFDGDTQYNIRKDKIIGIKGLNYDSIDELKNLAGHTSDYNKRRNLWKNAVRTMEYTIGLKKLPQKDIVYLNEAIKLSLGGDDLQLVYQEVVLPEPPGSYWPYIITDRLYKYFGIRLNSNWPILSVVFFVFFFMFYGAYKKRKASGY